jgi:two-component system, cell cycle sensor histidine kinase and response regulator CckA
MTQGNGHDSGMKSTIIEDAHFQERTRLLFNNSRTAAIVNICIAFLTFLAIPSQTYVWLWLILGIAVIRLIFHFWFKRQSEQRTNLKEIYLLTLILVALQGASWGIASILLYNSATDFHRFYLIAIICGMTGGGVLTLAPSILAFSCFTLPAVVPLVFTFLIQSDKTFRHAGFMGVVFLLAIHLLAKRISDSNVRLLESRSRLEITTTELARHKEHLEVLVQERTKELADSRENYRQLTEEINDAIFELDSEGRITYLSPAITAITGHQPEKMLGLHFSDIVFLDDLPKIQEKFHMVLSGILEPAEFRIIDSAGIPHWVRTSSRPILSDAGTRGIRGILTDIENEKQEMIEKTKLLQRIHDNQKLEAIGTLAGGIAHDFNNILSVIIGFCEITKISNAENRSVCDNMDKVLKASERARGLVRQILTFSKKTQQDRELVEPHILLHEGIELLSGSIPKTIKIVENISKDSAPILADPAQFNQIIVNLCTNAYYAMKEKGGVLEISLDSVMIDSETAHLLSDMQAAGPYVRLKVGDTGHGIPDESLPRIFEPFYTTKPTGEGTGLGLSVIHGVIRSMGGAITVESKVGKGSIFTIYLPRQEEKISATTDSTNVPQGNGEHILVVDDEEMLAYLGQELLLSLGYTVTMTTSGKDCLNKFLAEPSAYDAVVTDQTMPDITGIQLAVEIMGVRPDLPVIICTGHSDILNEEKAAQMNIAAFLNKPFRRDILAKTLHEVLDKKGSQIRSVAGGRH